MNRLAYFRARIDATVSPVDLFSLLKTNPEHVCVIDVRNGPAELIKDRIPNALQIPQNVLVKEVARLPLNRHIVLYCWDTWCSLAARAAVPLIERGFDVREMYGGIAAWKALHFPTVPADAEALASQTAPLPRY